MKQRGFIALMSAIIIAVVLLLLTTTGSLSSLYGRLDVLDGELKQRSAAAADACVDEALLHLAQDPSYTGTSVQALNNLDSCRVVVTSGTPNLKVQATSSTAVTNLLVSVNTATLAVQSWIETSVF